MGTTLTGTTPQDTYDSLIKVTNNGPLSSTARYLSDGLGNDSALALSTAQVGVGTTTLGTNYPLTIRSAAADYTKMLDWGTAVGGSWGSMTINTASPYETILTSGEWAFKTGSTERMRITSAGNVGIGTGSPQSTLDVRKLSTNLGTTSELGLLISNTGISGQYAQIGFGYSESTCAAVIAGVITNPSGATTSNLVFATRSGTSGATAPVERVRVTENGLTFNGDTAAANALDDYEEGTFTPTFAGGLTGVTYSQRYGSYTKIGNRVMFDLRIQASAVTGTSGSLVIGGLPFATSSAAISNGTIGYFGVYTTDIVYCLMDTSAVDAILFYKKNATPLLGSELTADTSAIHLSGVYFV